MDIEKLNGWIEDNGLDANFLDARLFTIGEDQFYFIDPEERLFNGDFHLNVSNDDLDLVDRTKCKNFCFKFGNNFYYTPVDSIEDPKLNTLKYIGTRKTQLEGVDFSFLGLRGRYEICNGSGEYGDWIKKAKFNGVGALGICEHHTLAGTLPFQQECKSSGMDFVLGESVLIEDSSFYQYEAKLYVLNEEGWFNLLYINKIINIDNESNKKIQEDDIVKYGKGLVFVFGPDTNLNDDQIDLIERSFDKVFFQFDTTEFKGHEKDKARLLSLKGYLENYIDRIDPILINDAFYLDKEYSHVKKILNTIGGVKFQSQSKDQHFKSLDEVFIQWSELFKEEDDRLFDLFYAAIDSTMWVSDNANFEIETGARHLPKFEHDGEESNDELFLRLLQEGMERKGLVENEEYWDRLGNEIEVISKGGVIDYFLILWDIVEWCKSKNILTGIGRGSAAGCLVSYLLDVTGVDPIEYGLLFERFLNEGRVKTSLPDIDTDFEGERRDEVKRYMEQKYGIEYVCSVGTYGTFKLKSALQEIGKKFHLDGKALNYISNMLELGPGMDTDISQLFKQALEKPQLKKFINQNPHVIDTIPIILKNVRNQSVHACATLILPKKDQHGRDRNIYNWMPVKMIDGVLVSEWEGGYLEDAGFLKEDILGIKQLDKFRGVFDKVKKNKGIDLSFESMDLEDLDMYDLFQKGHSSDVFHFGSRGLTGYSQEVLPTNINEMIDMISLYRPGAMESHAHTDYVKFKFGVKEPEFDYMLEEVTRETYGLYIYQEQVMKAVQVLGGFDLVVADDIRKAMGKKKMKLIREYQSKFVEGAKDRGCSESDAIVIWNKLEAFAGYGFNKSHAAAYSITGCMSQWLKVKHPLEFWTTAFEWASKDDIQRYVSELSKLNNGVSIMPPCVNKSSTEFISDPNSNEIYWAINKISFVGMAATEAIVGERQKNGDYSSLKNFLGRVAKRAVNKRVMENLILGGCFDKVCKVKAIVDRRSVLYEYYEIEGIKEDHRVDIPEEAKFDWYWVLMQKKVSQFGHFDFNTMVIRSKLSNLVSYYDHPDKMLLEKSLDKTFVQAGVIKDLVLRKTKKKDEFASILLECNDEEIYVLIWPKQWAKFKSVIEDSRFGVLIISGTVKFDGFKKVNVLQTNNATKVDVF